MTAPRPTGWSVGSIGKVKRLVSARVLTTLVGVGWFLTVARVLDAEELGVLAAGLATFATISVLADLGTSWSIMREVTVDPGRAWPLYLQGARLKVAAAFPIGGVVLAVAMPLVDMRVWVSMSIAVAITIASGLSEVGLSTLRALGAVRLESFALPLERLLFVLLALSVLLATENALVIMCVYVVTNAVTATVVWWVVRRRCQRVVPTEGARLWTRETRRTGLAFAVLSLGPRLAALTVVLVASVSEVADYSVATRLVEQVTVLVIGSGSVLLPLLRDDLHAGRAPSIRASFLITSVAILATPFVVWTMMASESIIDVLYGAGRYATAHTVLTLVVIVSVTWPLRSTAGMVMVAEERAGELALISMGGLLLNLAMAVPLGMEYGAVGVAWSLLISDTLTAAILAERSGVVIPPGGGRIAAAGFALGVPVGLVAGSLTFWVGLPAAVAGTLAVGVVVIRLHQRMTRTGVVQWT